MTVNRNSLQKSARKKGKTATRPTLRRAARRPKPVVRQVRASGNGHSDSKDGVSTVRAKQDQRSSTSHHDNLESERREVSGELARLRAELQETPEATGDEVDLSVYDREKTLGLIAGYERRLSEIERAVRAAQNGAYGVCERCRQPIDPARLAIFPEATLCVKCKNEKEQLAKRGILQ